MRALTTRTPQQPVGAKEEAAPTIESTKMNNSNSPQPDQAPSGARLRADCPTIRPVEAEALRANLVEAGRFLVALDPDPCATFGFRTCADHGDDIRLAVKAFGSLDCGIRQSKDPSKDGKRCHPARLLSFMQNMGAGAFVVVNKLDGRGQLKANITAIRALYVDADSRREVEAVHAFLSTTGLIPTAMVASGGVHDGVEKLQVYWRIEGCPVLEFTDAQLTLVSRIGTDPAVHDVGRVMRLPGFWHQKREPRQTRIVSIAPTGHYEFAEFMARVTAQPQIVDPWASSRRARQRTAPRRGGNVITAATAAAGPTARLRILLDMHGGLITPAVRALLREAVPPEDGRPGNRHATMVSAVARCMQAGWPDADIRALVLPVINGEWGGPDRSDRLEQIIAWTRGQENTAIAATPASLLSQVFAKSARARGAA